MIQVLRKVRVLRQRMINQHKYHLAVIHKLGVSEDLVDNTNDNDSEDSWNKDTFKSENNLDLDNKSF